MTNTADVTGGKPIAVRLNSTSGGSDVNSFTTSMEERERWHLLATGWSAGNFFTFYIECLNEFLILLLTQFVTIRHDCLWWF
jgi:hypothetical protein